jgi:hypothetical protein
VVDWTHNAGYIVFSSVVHCCFETGGLNHERCWSCRRHTRGMLFRPCVLQIGTPTKVSGPKTADCFAMGMGWGDITDPMYRPKLCVESKVPTVGARNPTLLDHDVQLVNCMFEVVSAVQLFLVNYFLLMIVHLQSLMVFQTSGSP